MDDDAIDDTEIDSAVEDGTISWRQLRAEAMARFETAGFETAEADLRWIVEEASGHEGLDYWLGLDDLATERGVARFDRMVARRLAGEPLQYVLGRWAFRSLDLAVDARVLIPRPETEQVVEVALRELDALVARDGADPEPVVVDLGTGSGAIALSVAVERQAATVWAVERSPAALSVARGNLAGIGRAATRVRMVEGSWFDPLPPELRGSVHLVISNPPYVAPDDELPAVVRDWEPMDALVPGPTGLEAVEAICAGAIDWLAPGGVLVIEIGETQGGVVLELAATAGLVDARIEPDLNGRPRALVARRPA